MMAAIVAAIMSWAVLRSDIELFVLGVCDLVKKIIGS
jgi:hypothetical protein